MKFAIVAVLALAICHVSAFRNMSIGLLTKLKTQGVADAIIVLNDRVAPVVESINSKKFINSVIKTTALVKELRRYTAKSQLSILHYLQKSGAVGVQAFWITNRIFVPKATLELIMGVSSIFTSHIAEIREPIVARIDFTVNGHDSNPQELEWGVDNINAPAVWADGYTGEGVVVSHSDTGVRPSHEAFQGSMRNTHAWFDPYSGSINASDEQGHGTHTMATMVGRAGTGVAPGATFITCKGCDIRWEDVCIEFALLACGQWTTCPTQPDGSDEDCSKKPALSSNSWAWDKESTWYNDVINVWKAANIVPIFAAGNAGPECRSVYSPGDQPGLISVGATTINNDIAPFSARGPSLIFARIKPDISAPGDNVRSASHTGDSDYATQSGTSMATPHVAGAVAVLLSKNSELTYEQVDTLLKESTFHPRIDQINCTDGGVNVTNPWPNNSFGHGIIDLKRAADAVPGSF